jgi:hypothetical protein
MVTPEIIITPENTETLPAPSETEIPNIIEITAENTEVATEAITTDVVTVLYFRDFFGDADLPEWTFGAGWAFVPTIPNDQALQVFNNSSPATYILQDFFNVDAEIRTFVQHGAVQLTVRESVSGRYTATLEPSGQISLSRAGMVVMSQTIPNFNAFVWHQVRLSAQNQMVRVFVDNLQVLVFNDPNLLPMGKVSFNGVFYPMGDATPSLPQNTIQVDEFSIFVPSSEIGVLQTPVPLVTSEALPNATPTFSSDMNFMPFMPEEPAMMAFSAPTFFCENVDPVKIVAAGDVSGLKAALYDAQSCPDTEFFIYVRMSDDPNSTNTFLLDTVGNFGLYIQGNVTLLANGATFSPSAIEGDRYPLFLVDANASIRIHHAILKNAYNSPSTTRSSYGGAINNLGYLYLFDSQFINNVGTQGGGAIMNRGNLSVERTAFVGNSAGGGGAIQNDSSGQLSITCSTFKDNRGNYAAALLNGIVSNDDGRVTVKYSKFQGNATNLGNPSNIVNLQSGNEYEYEVIADNNYWVGEMAVGADIRVDNPLATDPTIVNPTTGQYDYSDCIPRKPRIVPDEAVAFHVYADKFGLPMPFDRLPYNIIQPGQPDDPLGILNGKNFTTQGFGVTKFASENKIYSLTFGIHSGIDYGGKTWDDRVIVSLCDGVIIPGNGFLDNGTPSGGSAQPGRGVSIRCFMDTLAENRADTDGDGLPNLSNIVVTYNHLLWGTVGQPPPHKISCDLISNFTICEEDYDLPKIGDVVVAGEPIGQTGGGGAEYFDHLHLSVFFAKGFARANLNENAFYLNPMLMYTENISKQHFFQPYFPSKESDEVLGILVGEITRWSAGGFNSIPNGKVESNNFWEVQEASTPGPSHVEWPYDNYPLVPANSPNSITDISEFLVTRYSQFPYQTVNCNLSLDEIRTPIRTIATCDLSDLTDETPYSPPIIHGDN